MDAHADRRPSLGRSHELQSRRRYRQQHPHRRVRCHQRSVWRQSRPEEAAQHRRSAGHADGRPGSAARTTGGPTRVPSSNSSTSAPTGDLTQTDPEAVIPWTQNYQVRDQRLRRRQHERPELARRQQLCDLRHLQGASRILRARHRGQPEAQARQRQAHPGSRSMPPTSKAQTRVGDARFDLGSALREDQDGRQDRQCPSR